MIKLVYRAVHFLDDCIGVHATIVNENNEIVAITKYPIGPRNPGKGFPGFLDEVAKFADDIKNNPPITNWTYGVYHYIFVNGWDDIVVSDIDLQLLYEKAFM